jgi:hypothetical protein
MSIKQTRIEAKMMGHGHVTPNHDGSKARCGGPAICIECGEELKELQKKSIHIDSELCWCDPELKDYTDHGGSKHYVHREYQ